MTINDNITARSLELNSGVENVTYKLMESDKYQPGVLVSLLQFFITKLRLKKNFKIDIEVGDIVEKELISNFYMYYQLVVLVLYDKSGRTSFSNQPKLLSSLINSFKKKVKLLDNLYSVDLKGGVIDDEFSKKELNDLRNALFALKSKPKIENGFSLMIPCFDHLRRDGLNESQYFYNLSQIKPSEDIEAWVERLFSFHKINLDHTGFSEDSNTFHISEILKELFSNTHDWAKTTYDDEANYLPNFRGSYISLFLESRLKKDLHAYDYTDDYLKRVYSTDKSLLQLSRGTTGEVFSDKKVSICEISVMDTGPGMARRWLGKDYTQITREEEVDAVIRCFHKYITSDESGRMNLRGQGLSKVLNIIGKTGFIRIYSGQVLLTRDFLKDQLTEEEIQGGELKFDSKWVNRAEGTCITILYPILYSIPEE